MNQEEMAAMKGRLDKAEEISSFILKTEWSLRDLDKQDSHLCMGGCMWQTCCEDIPTDQRRLRSLFGACWKVG
ncbi:hypothetical protein M0R72_10520 [Candidatus Pacearchaeota archaeon]|jgi:hypothetical protein|nr:hypothetical protein [Candidatus Pacearchaeota archaeon]